MVPAALAASMEEDEPGRSGPVCLRGVAWCNPVISASEPLTVHIGLEAQQNGEIEYEIYSIRPGSEAGVEADVEAGLVIHAQGRAHFVVAERAGEVESIDVAGLQAGSDRLIEASQCYAHFEAMGLEYAATHRGLQRLCVGSDAQGVRYVLAEVSLPPEVSDT